MKIAAYYGIATAVSLGAIAAEATYARLKKRDWYDAADAVGNLNLGAGNLLAGLLLAIVVTGGYAAIFTLRIADASARLPTWAAFALATLFADFLQYWNHRLSHRVNLLWAGHITHHSSAHLNLTTAIRINWFYRGYAWILYAPMPLLGFSFESFVAAQAVINTWNLFMHTRAKIPFGPLEWVFVSPASHGLHHSSDPKHFGNYGAALIVWDRLFGTYREIASDNSEAPSYGIGRSLGTNPIRLNLHHFVELGQAARAQHRSLVRVLFSQTAATAPSASAMTTAPASRAVGAVSAVALALVLLTTLAIQATASTGAMTARHALHVLAGLTLVVALGVGLERGDARPSSDGETTATRAPGNAPRPNGGGGVLRALVLAALGLTALGAVFGPSLRGTPVTVTPVVRGKAIEAVYASGAVEAEERVLLRAKTSGALELLVREGATVHRGDLIARIANAGLQYDLERGRADLTAASAMAQDDASPINTLEAEARAVQSELNVARRDLDRVEALARSNAVPPAEVDRARAKVSHLDASLAANLARQRTMKLDLTANVARQGAQVRTLASRVADAEIRSPIDGVVLQKHASSGDTVSANQPLLHLGDTAHLQLEVHVDEADVARISDGSMGSAASEVAVRLYAFPSKTFRGTVVEILPDANRERRAYVTKVHLAEPPSGLRSGMTAEVNIIAKKIDDALLVPTLGVQAGEVWINDDGRARARKVTVGIRDLSTVEVLTGLAAGELVIVDPPANLREGDRVRATIRDARPATREGVAEASLR